MSQDWICCISCGVEEDDNIGVNTNVILTSPQLSALTACLFF